MPKETEGWTEGGGAAWERDSREAGAKRTVKVDTSVGPERTAFTTGNLSNPGTGANRSAPAREDVLMNPLTRPRTASKADGGKLLQNKLTRGRGKK